MSKITLTAKEQKRKKEKQIKVTVALMIILLQLDFSLENQIMRHRSMTITHISESILILELSELLRMGLQELNSAISFL